MRNSVSQEGLLDIEKMSSRQSKHSLRPAGQWYRKDVSSGGMTATEPYASDIQMSCIKSIRKLFYGSALAQSLFAEKRKFSPKIGVFCQTGAKIICAVLRF